MWDTRIFGRQVALLDISSIMTGGCQDVVLLKRVAFIECLQLGEFLRLLCRHSTKSVADQSVFHHWEYHVACIASVTVSSARGYQYKYHTIRLYKRYHQKSQFILLRTFCNWKKKQKQNASHASFHSVIMYISRLGCLEYLREKKVVRQWPWYQCSGHIRSYPYTSDGPKYLLCAKKTQRSTKTVLDTWILVWTAVRIISSWLKRHIR